MKRRFDWLISALRTTQQQAPKFTQSFGRTSARHKQERIEETTHRQGKHVSVFAGTLFVWQF
jgi:F0F1-type ATP synthase membrane subunit a